MQARELKVNEVAVFTSATEGFSEKNINCSVDESIERFKVIISESQIDNAKVEVIYLVYINVQLMVC